MVSMCFIFAYSSGRMAGRQAARDGTTSTCRVYGHQANLNNFHMSNGKRWLKITLPLDMWLYVCVCVHGTCRLFACLSNVRHWPNPIIFYQSFCILRAITFRFLPSSCSTLSPLPSRLLTPHPRSARQPSLKSRPTMKLSLIPLISLILPFSPHRNDVRIASTLHSSDANSLKIW